MPNVSKTKAVAKTKAKTTAPAKKPTTKAKATRAPKTTKANRVAETEPTVEILEPQKPQEPKQEAYSVDLSKGTHKSFLSQEWFTRPMDQRFVSMDDLTAFIEKRHERARETIIDISDLSIRQNGSVDIIIKDSETKDEIPVHATNFTSSQLCTMAGIPKPLLGKLSQELAIRVVEERLAAIPSGQVKTLTYHNDQTDKAQLAAITPVDWGRIWDLDILRIVHFLMDIDDGWKVPGEMDWSSMKMNPNVEITKENTTLYASDRDISIFLAKDADPIEAGKTKRGEPDLYFPGFYICGSEQGNGKPNKMAGMMLRGVCANRTLWGVENLKEIQCRHSKKGPERFQQQATLMMRQLKQADCLDFIDLLKSARAKTLASTDDDAWNVLRLAGFGHQDTRDIINISVEDEDTPPRSAYDFHQAVTAFGRKTDNHQDARIEIEKKANKFLEAAA